MSTIEFADLAWFAAQLLGSWTVGFIAGATARVIVDVMNTSGRG